MTQRTVSHLLILIFFHLNPGWYTRDKGCLVGRQADGDMPTVAYEEVALGFKVGLSTCLGTGGRNHRDGEMITLPET